MSYNPYTTFAKGCFLADTPVKTPQGTVMIQDLTPGDLVVSFNEKTGKLENSSVEKIEVLGAREYFTIKTASGSVDVTSEHPFYTKDKDENLVTVKVSELREDDFIVAHYFEDTIDEERILSIRKHVKDVVIYNLINVTPNHNYFVGDASFLVHNKGGCFVYGTPISTKDGTVPIQELSVGDKIISYNESTLTTEESIISDIDSFNVKGYYEVETETHSVGVTLEHPFYIVNADGEMYIKTVGELKIGDTVHLQNGTFELITDVTYHDEVVRVYNLINVAPNHNYFANRILVHNKGGGGCFLPGTKIMTPTGSKKIEKIRPGDTVVSFNENDKVREYSRVSSVQVLRQDGYYIINDSVKVTATHPMYVYNNKLWLDNPTPRQVQDLKIGDMLATDAGGQIIVKIEYVDKAVTVYNLIDVEPNNNYYANNYLVHNKGGFSSGGRSSSSSKSSSSKSSSTVGKSTSSSTGSKGSSKSTNGGSTANKSNSRSTTSSSTKPGTKITTSSGKSVQTSSKKPTSSKVNQQAGITGVDGYTPKFKNGYSAPEGSVVYYPQHSFTDYLPWIYLFSQNSPANDQATIVQPDGKQVSAPPVEEGMDGLAIFNWVLLFIIGACIIGSIVWGVNKFLSRNDNGW